MSFKHGLLLLSLFCGYDANPFLEDHDSSSFFVDPAARPIVGGDVAPPGSAPYMVALFLQLDKLLFDCGGSLISSRTVLTAAHCLQHEVSSYIGKVGTNHLNSGGSKIYFEKTIPHPKYTNLEIKNDIGLMITRGPVQFSELVKPITLSYQYVGGGLELKASGWGKTQVNGENSNELLQLLMTSVDTPECQKAISLADPLSMMCALHSVNHGLCHGDSGSALVRTDSGAQVGVVSYGIPCATGVPDVFTRVSAFEHFIETNKVL